ncbi:hypothetical protein ABGV42_00565 [Paenibacillus pabuli]|uniref:hypothetical protein n=1 Tax=Paenibacillus pabuli TaxID=1472 RepID=UPI0032422930
MYNVVINLDSEEAANFVKEHIEKSLPLLKGVVSIYKQPEVTSLDKVIESVKNGNYSGKISVVAKDNIEITEHSEYKVKVQGYHEELDKLFYIKDKSTRTFRERLRIISKDIVNHLMDMSMHFTDGLTTYITNSLDFNSELSQENGVEMYHEVISIVNSFENFCDKYYLESSKISRINNVLEYLKSDMEHYSRLNASEIDESLYVGGPEYTGKHYSLIYKHLKSQVPLLIDELENFGPIKDKELVYDMKFLRNTFSNSFEGDYLKFHGQLDSLINFAEKLVSEYNRNK